MLEPESNDILSRVRGAPKHISPVVKYAVGLNSLNGRERIELHFLRTDLTLGFLDISNVVTQFIFQ